MFIQLKNITLKYGKLYILRDFNLSVESGEHLCLWGPSGSGKTTLLKLLMGLLIPESGSIEYEGKLINESNVSELRKHISWIPQNFNLPVRNSKELLSLLRFNISHKDVLIKKINDFGLDSSLTERDFTEVSIGQKQRIVLAATLLANRKIILLDEPTASLDVESIDLLIKTILKDRSKTIISASHDEKWAKAHDRIIYLEQHG